MQRLQFLNRSILTWNLCGESTGVRSPIHGRPGFNSRQGLWREYWLRGPSSLLSHGYRRLSL